MGPRIGRLTPFGVPELEMTYDRVLAPAFQALGVSEHAKAEHIVKAMSVAGNRRGDGVPSLVWDALWFLKRKVDCQEFEISDVRRSFSHHAALPTDKLAFVMWSDQEDEDGADLVLLPDVETSATTLHQAVANKFWRFFEGLGMQRASSFAATEVTKGDVYGKLDPGSEDEVIFRQACSHLQLWLVLMDRWTGTEQIGDIEVTCGGKVVVANSSVEFAVHRGHVLLAAGIWPAAAVVKAVLEFAVPGQTTRLDEEDMSIIEVMLTRVVNLQRGAVECFQTTEVASACQVWEFGTRYEEDWTQALSKIARWLGPPISVTHAKLSEQVSAPSRLVQKARGLPNIGCAPTLGSVSEHWALRSQGGQTHWCRLDAEGNPLQAVQAPSVPYVDPRALGGEVPDSWEDAVSEVSVSHASAEGSNGGTPAVASAVAWQSQEPGYEGFSTGARNWQTEEQQTWQEQGNSWWCTEQQAWRRDDGEHNSYQQSATPAQQICHRDEGEHNSYGQSAIPAHGQGVQQQNVAQQQGQAQRGQEGSSRWSWRWEGDRWTWEWNTDSERPGSSWRNWDGEGRPPSRWRGGCFPVKPEIALQRLYDAWGGSNKLQDLKDSAPLESLNVADVRYPHSSIRGRFMHGRWAGCELVDVAQRLLAGSVRVETIEVMFARVEDEIWSLNNRSTFVLNRFLQLSEGWWSGEVQGRIVDLCAVQPGVSRELQLLCLLKFLIGFSTENDGQEPELRPNDR